MRKIPIDLDNEDRWIELKEGTKIRPLAADQAHELCELSTGEFILRYHGSFQSWVRRRQPTLSLEEVKEWLSNAEIYWIFEEERVAELKE